MRISSPTIIQIILLCVTISVTGCTQSSQEETVITTTIYDGCCGTAPKVYEVEDYKVYIPNVITPNGDGINDAFYPICNKMMSDMVRAKLISSLSHNFFCLVVSKQT